MTEHPPEQLRCARCHDPLLDAIAASGHLVISREDAQAIVDASEGFTTTSNAALDRLAALLEGGADG